MKSTFTLTKSDLKRAGAIHVKRNKIKTYTIIIILFILVGYALHHNEIEKFIVWSVFISIWMSLIGFIAYWYLIWKIGKSFDESNDYRGLQSVQIIDNKLEIECATSTSKWGKSDIFKIVRGSSYILIYKTSLMFYIIPKVVVSENPEINSWMSNNFSEK
jgi:hypothetical protein